MHRSLSPLAALLFTGAVAGAHATNVSLSIGGEITPGVYGRVDIGNTPPPILYPQPVVITRATQPVARPLYLHVPPGHAKNWAKHCHKYNACSQPVYFVKSAEYEAEAGHKGGKGHHKHKHD